MRIRTHPGEILREEFMVPLDISARQLAEHIGVSHTTINAITAEKRQITTDLAFRLGKVFKTTPQFWMNLQQQYDISVAEDAHAKDYSAIRPLAAV